MNSGDVLPTMLGIALVAAAAAFVLLPFARGPQAEPSSVANAELTPVNRLVLYRQVLELEFDHQTGKLATEDFTQQSSELLARAGQALRLERGTFGELDEEIEREIAAARAAFAAARSSSRKHAETASS